MISLYDSSVFPPLFFKTSEAVAVKLPPHASVWSVLLLDEHIRILFSLSALLDIFLDHKSKNAAKCSSKESSVQPEHSIVACLRRRAYYRTILDQNSLSLVLKILMLCDLSQSCLRKVSASIVVVMACSSDLPASPAESHSPGWFFASFLLYLLMYLF